MTCTVVVTMVSGKVYRFRGCPLGEALGMDDSWRAGKTLRFIGQQGITIELPAEYITDVSIESDAGRMP